MRTCNGYCGYAKSSTVPTNCYVVSSWRPSKTPVILPRRASVGGLAFIAGSLMLI